MEHMKNMEDGCVHLTLTDVPYGEVNRDSNGLRVLDKEQADVMTFKMNEFLNEVYRVTNGTIIIFCGKEQLSEIHKFFSDMQKKGKGTVRQLIWEKSNPSPMNGQYIYLSGIENAVWFKKRGGSFNAHCKNTVFKYPCGRSKLHPTEKNHDLLRELILDNSRENDIVFDPCSGSGSHLLVAKQNNRRFVGCELNEQWCEVARERLESEE
jgi:DNA modification methylase